MRVVIFLKYLKTLYKCYMGGGYIIITLIVFVSVLRTYRALQGLYCVILVIKGFYLYRVV